MVSYPQVTQASEVSPRDPSLCHPAGTAERRTEASGDTRTNRVTHGCHNFQTMCHPKNLSVSKGKTIVGCRRGHMFTTYGRNKKMRSIGPLECCVESNCDPCVTYGTQSTDCGQLIHRGVDND